MKIIDSYGGTNKSKWIGERIEEWYMINKSEIERINNRIRWTQFRKNELEDELAMLAKLREKLKQVV